MIIIRNKFIPLKGFKALAFFPFLLVRSKATLKQEDITHEAIHFQQQIEMLLIGFYVWYCVEFLIRLIGWLHRLNWQEFRVAADLAYHDISFEREAYENEDNLKYLEERNPFSWIQYLG